MTEAEWHNCSSPQEMLRFLNSRGFGSARKLRLFAVACCRRVWDAVSRDAAEHHACIPKGLLRRVSLAEAYADATITASELAAEYDPSTQWNLLGRAGFPSAIEACLDACHAASLPDTHLSALQTCGSAGLSVGELARGEDWSEDSLKARRLAALAELKMQASLLREIFGNLFYYHAFEPSWRTETAQSLSRSMYESREFSLMPILADALQDAGCDNPDVLDHCRSEGPHTRGCWVIDLLLNRE